MQTVVLAIGMAMTGLTLIVASRRAWFLYRIIGSGQPTEEDREIDLGRRAVTQLREVFGQRRLLRWTIPGIAHFFTFWAFVVLLTVYIEAYGALFQQGFAIPAIGRKEVLGGLQDGIALAVLVAIIVFAILRFRDAPQRLQRGSRFYGSHTGGAWLILFMIFNVVWTIFLFRGAASALGHLPYDSGAFVSVAVGNALDAVAGPGILEPLEAAGELAHIGVMLVFLIIVLYSKHLHIFIAPLNVAGKREPKALGPLEPMYSRGKEIDFEDPDEDDIFGRGVVEDFTWKGMLDFATCTECGRCQSQCPAWNTGKPLSPKLVVMDLRDHLFAKAPYILGEQEMPDHSDVDVLAAAGNGHHVPEAGFGRVAGSGPEQATRPLVGTAEQGGVIDPDVLWSCTTCGACVEQCPVDIEHVDHIVDMRRYQVLIESEFPSELGTMFRNLENKGNPWGQNQSARMDWAKDLDFEVPVHDGGPLDDDVEYLFWIGCAGAFDDNARKTVRATAELLHIAGVNYRVLGQGETCTGDPARRSGNEFVYQMLAAQNVETLNGVFSGREPGRRKIVTTCPHCFNTIGREYPQLDGHYEVVHHTQLLNQLVREKKLVTVPGGPSDAPSVTYHDPCYLGRHNEVYSPPRELVGASGAQLTEMPRHADRSFCCGAGGARMWMEEHIGKRVNLDRVDEAVATETEKVATGCPFCRVMITDGLTTRQEENAAGNQNEVLDVAQLLLAGVKRGMNGHGPGAVDREGADPKVAPAQDSAGDSDTPSAPGESADETTAESANADEAAADAPKRPDEP